MQRTKLAGNARQVVVAIAIVVGVSTALSGCIPNQPNLKNAYLVNTERMDRNLRPYGWDDELAAKARAWAQQMANANTIQHSQLTDGITRSWRVLGENVGAGSTIDEVHQAFMNSPEHRKVILSGAYDTMGIGVVQQNGQFWVVEVYRG